MAGFLWGKILINVFTHEICYMIRRNKIYFKNTVVEIAASHRRMTIKTFCVSGKM